LLKGKASIVWKEAFWGSRLDGKLLDYLKTFPTLESLTGSPSENKRWTKGQGFQPQKQTQKTGSFKSFSF